MEIITRTIFNANFLKLIIFHFILYAFFCIMIQQIIVIINSNTITNKTVCKIFYFSLLLLYYDSLLKQYLFTFGAIVLVFSVNTISIITITISSHLVTEVSATLFKYLLFSQIHVLGSRYNLFHTYDNFYIHIDMCYYFIFVLNYILYC